MRATLAISVLALGLPAMAFGQNSGAVSMAEAAGMNMRLAMRICLSNIRNPSQLLGGLTAVGFEAGEQLENGIFELSAPGLYIIAGQMSQVEGYCKIESALVPLETAIAIGDAVAESLYPGAATRGGPASPANGQMSACDGYSFWDARPVISVSYSQAGNSGECINDGSSAILVR